jgi:hypothetical protein
MADEAHRLSVQKVFPEAVRHRRSWNQYTFYFCSRPMGKALSVGRSDLEFE